MIFNDIKQYSGVRLGGFCSAWLRVLDCVLRQKALEVFLEVSNGILWLVWLLLCYMDEALDDAMDMMHSCPLSQWCHPTISSSAIPFSSCLQSFLASGSFPMSQFFASGLQSIGASASVLPMNIQDWFPLGWTGWISLQSKGLSRVFSNTTVQKHQLVSAQLSLYSNSHIHTWLLEKP